MENISKSNETIENTSEEVKTPEVSLESTNDQMNKNLDNLEKENEKLKDVDAEKLIQMAEKNPKLKEKIKTILGIVAVLAGAGAVAYGFNGAVDFSAGVRELFLAGGLGVGIAGAMIGKLRDKLLALEIPGTERTDTPKPAIDNQTGFGNN